MAVGSIFQRALARPQRRPAPARRDVAIVVVLFALSFWQNLSDLRFTPFHPDETRWLNRAHYVRDLFDPFGPTWDDGYLTRTQPPLGSYLMGIGLLLQGRDLTTNGVWNFSYGRAWNTAQGNMADQADLDAGRRTNAVVGALTVVVVYLVAKRLSNRVAGVVAGLFLAANPLFIRQSSQALSDVLVALLVALAALAACRLADRPSWPRALLLGVILGLGGAAKLSPLLLTIPLAGIGAILLAWPRLAPRLERVVPGPTWTGLTWRRGEAGAKGLGRRAVHQLGVMLLLLPLVGYATFVAVYPYLWPDPVTRTVNLFEHRVQEMEQQGENWPNVAVEGRLDALRRVGVILGEKFSTSGRLAAKVAGGLGTEWRPQGIDVLVALIGFEVLLARTVWGGWGSPFALAGAVLGGQAALIVLGLRSDFARYHMPLLVVEAVLVGLALGWLWALVERSSLPLRLRATAYGLLDQIVSGSSGSPEGRSRLQGARSVVLPCGRQQAVRVNPASVVRRPNAPVGGSSTPLHEPQSLVTLTRRPSTG